MTYAVIGRALALSALSDSAFDITIASELVARGHLPHPPYAPEPDGAANWRDIELLPDNHVRFARALWIDLGGIAKGYAVDRAMTAIARFAPAQACVNAGGDLSIKGPDAERVMLCPRASYNACTPMIELRDGSLASSKAAPGGPHVLSRRCDVAAPQFVSVTAPHCIDADALTKVVLARREQSAPVLATLGASAVIHDADAGWRQIDGTAQ